MIERMPELWKWLEQNLFTNLSYQNKFFPHEVVLYSDEPYMPLTRHLQRMEEQFTKAELYGAVMKACATYKFNQDALWFHVNVIDRAVWALEDYKEYPYPLPYSEKPLATLFRRMEKYPADQSGLTYVGLLSNSRKWMLLIEHRAHSDGSDFNIYFCGPEYLCKTARSFLKTKSV
jgi:hypothetical protein